MIASMVRLMPILGSDMKVRRLRTGVPLTEAVLDEPGGRYVLEKDLPPKAGMELRAHRAPCLRQIVKMALESQTAEELVHKLRQRFEHQQQRRGIETGRTRRDAELDRLLGQD
jgi:hypothetical protein